MMLNAAETCCTLTCQAERTAYASAAGADLLAMANLQAPPAPADVARPPMELVAVVDRSGSMQGQKILLMKQTLTLLVQRGGLQAQDKLGIVVFDHNVKAALTLTRMDQAGRRAAQAVVDGICVGGQTNLSGGLLAGLQLLCQSDESARERAADAEDGESAVLVAGGDGDGGGAAATRSLLLFTDGHANQGITDGAAMVAAAQAVLKDHPAVSIFSFGYGDHDEEPLRALATATRGLFYFIEQPDAIPAAFADCLGGLSSVVCQNATLELRAAGGRRATATLGRVVDATTYPASQGADGALTLQLGDLYAEDEKAVLLHLALAALPEPRDAPHAVLEATLSYYAVGAKRFECVEAQLELARPAAPPEGAAAPNVQLDEQRNRLEAAEAIEKASALADRGDREGGKALLTSAMSKVGTSASSRTAASRALHADLERLALHYEDDHTYTSTGSKRSKASAVSHRQQRDACSSFDAAESRDLGYSAGKASKAGMRHRWSSR